MMDTACSNRSTAGHPYRVADTVEKKKAQSVPGSHKKLPHEKKPKLVITILKSAAI